MQADSFWKRFFESALRGGGVNYPPPPLRTLKDVLDCPKGWFCLFSRSPFVLGQCRSDSKQGLRTPKDVTDCPKGGGCKLPPPPPWGSVGKAFAAQVGSMGTLRALKDIPDCPKAVARNGSP